MQLNKRVIFGIVFGLLFLAVARGCEQVDQSNTSWRNYSVKRGDTLVEIIDEQSPRRKWYQVDRLESLEEEIVQYNELRGIDAINLEEGQDLYLPHWNYGKQL